MKGIFYGAYLSFPFATLRNDPAPFGNGSATNRNVCASARNGSASVRNSSASVRNGSASVRNGCAIIFIDFFNQIHKKNDDKIMKMLIMSN